MRRFKHFHPSSWVMTEESKHGLFSLCEFYRLQSPLHAGKPQPLPVAVGNHNIIWHSRAWMLLCVCHTDCCELHSLSASAWANWMFGSTGTSWHREAHAHEGGILQLPNHCGHGCAACWEVALPCSLWAMPEWRLGESNLLQPKASQGPLFISVTVWIIALQNPGTSWSSSFASTDKAVVSLPALSSLCV